MHDETELGREVRAAVAKALKRFSDNDIAAIRVSDLRKIDALINPAPAGFEINTRRDNRAAAEVAIRHAKIRAEIDERTGWDAVAKTIAAQKAEGLRERLS